MAERYFIDDDKLNRKRYADFLKTIIDNSDKYKRNSEEKSYVIAVDSSWGTGKTYFTDMFENYLSGFDGKDLENHNGSYTVIRFDAWKNDFWDNAFEPFVASIMEKDIFDLDRDSQNAESLLKNLVVSAEIIAKGIIKKKAEDYIDPDSLDEAINKTARSTKDFLLRDSKLFSDYQEFKRGIEDFKEALLGLVDDKRKIVIIVDELDRCKPTFSIQLLEIVKHLFDMSGITFLFMIDIEQLSHSVKTVYGQGMDATGYLCRFFDYITRMPKPDIKAYIKNSFDGVELFDGCKNRDRDNFLNFFYHLCQRFDLSLRDIDTIICSYRIMLDSFLKEYKLVQAHGFYLFYLILKYKDVLTFNNIFLKNKVPEELSRLEFVGFSNIKESLGNITRTIDDLEYAIISGYYKNGIQLQTGEYLKVSDVQEDKLYVKRRNSSSQLDQYVSFTDDMNLNGILFAPDIRKWRKIKNMQYGHYIHQQLEMFNFVNAETKQK